MNRGTILQYTVGGHCLRVVVITADRYNPDHALVAPLRERATPELLPAFLVPLTTRDWPTAALIDLSRIRSIDPGAVRGEAGRLLPDTTRLLETAVRIYFGVRA